jgi:hypothetical protein
MGSQDRGGQSRDEITVQCAEENEQGCKVGWGRKGRKSVQLLDIPYIASPVLLVSLLRFILALLRIELVMCRHGCDSSDGRLKRFPNIGSQIWMMIFCCSGSGRGIDHQIYKIEEGDRVIEVMIKRISWPLMVMKRISRRR